MALETKIGQIYKFSRKHFEGDVFLHYKNDPNSGAILAAVAFIKDKRLARQVFQVLGTAFFAPYPESPQQLSMESRLSEVNSKLEPVLKKNENKMHGLSCALIEINKDILSAASTGQTIVHVGR